MIKIIQVFREMTVKTNGIPTKDRESQNIKATPSRAVDVTIRKSDVSPWEWWLCFSTITVMALCTRLHYLTIPNFVLWDEAHFGKMASWYLNRTFFFDVHPPGGKLLITLFGYLSGYNGTHSFKVPGESYEGFPEIMGMRLGCALMGAATVPLSFACVWNITNHSLLASVLAGLISVYEIGLITLSKLILLDPPLFFFAMLTFHAFTVFARQSHRPWSLPWLLSMGYTGFGLGCVVSVKFVGLLMFLVIGLYTVVDLWQIFGDRKNSLKDFVGHFGIRVIGLIMVPIFVYVSIFAVHDIVLDRMEPNPRKGDLGLSQFSAGFQMAYKNSTVENLTQPADVPYGSLVTLKVSTLGGSYLHSHNFSYPTSIFPQKLQQVTGYNGKDHNNVFRILFPTDDPDLSNGFYSGEKELVGDGNWVRLYHPVTNISVACGKNKSAMATKMNLIYGDPYDLLPPELAVDEIVPVPSSLWKVKTEVPGDLVSALRTRFQLINVVMGCGLAWTQQKLPESWGFRQAEIGCTRNLQNPMSFWHIEHNVNPYEKNVTFEHLKYGFWSRFIESHQMMFQVNAALKPQTYSDDVHRPWHWPIMYISHPWWDTDYRIVLLGNPLVFLLNLCVLFAAPVILIANSYRKTRPFKQVACDEDNEQYYFAMRWLLIAYLFHYVPFFFMHRILYYHHYFPALQFSNMLTAVTLAYLLENVSKRFHKSNIDNILFGVFLMLFILLSYSFYLYCYIGYGTKTTEKYNRDNSTYKHLRFFDGILNWDI